MFDIINNIKFSSDKTNLYHKNYIYYPKISLTDTL